MSSKRFPLIGGHTMRLTKTDRCGRPAYGDRAQLSSEGFIKIEQTANYEDGSDKSLTNAKGKRCAFRQAEPELLGVSLNVEFCEVDPDAYTSLTGFPAEYDLSTGDLVGFRLDRSVRPLDVGVALEAWTDATGTDGCDVGADVPWGYFLWPFLSGGRVGDYSIEDNAVSFSVTNLVSRDGSLWDRGPYAVVLNAAGQPDGLASPITKTQPAVVQRTLVPPPEYTDGLVPLDDPDGPAATGATAGLPGAFTPTGARRPYDLAGIQGTTLTKNPTGAWSTGQHVVLGDGTRAHWTGTAWTDLDA